MESFPQMMPLNSSGTEVVGFLSAMNEEFYVHLTVDKKCLPKKIHLKGSQELNNILKPVCSNLEQHLLQSASIKDMLNEIQNVLEIQLRSKHSVKSLPLPMDCSAMFAQLQECGWEKVYFISSDFREIHLKAVDDFEREHILKVWITEKFPNEGPKFDCDLPKEFSYKWLSDDSLKNIFNVFQEKVLAFAGFWNSMEEIDTNTWVLEPQVPQRSDCKRRVGLASGLSLLIIVNPELPTSVPTCHFLGPERLVESMRGKFNKNIHLWSEYDSVLHNLEEVLDMKFPSPLTTVKEDFCMECGICYSYMLEEAIPDMTCDNVNCNQPFHQACLYEYIRMLPDAKSSFNKIFGHCPYCNKPLWCNIP